MRSLSRISLSCLPAVCLAGAAPTAQTLREQKISSIHGGFVGPLADRDSFGRNPTAIGDLDGDGLSEVFVGAPCADRAGPNMGAGWVLFLNPDGTVRDEQEISEGVGGFSGPLRPLDIFANRSAALGDRDGDGVPDLLVSAPLHDDSARDGGAAWILYLNRDGTVKAQQKISGVAGGFGGTIGMLEVFGRGLAGLGDLDGDGVRDLAIGAIQENYSDPGPGVVWILFMNPDGTVRDERKISAGEGGFTGAITSGDHFGDAIADLGDLDGDGVLDIAVGAPTDKDGGSGSIWILFLNRDGTVRAHQKINATEGGFVHGATRPLDELGITVEAIEDLDGDGVPELLTGMINDDDGGDNTGSAFILYLRRDGTVKEQLKISRLYSDFGGTINAQDRFGYGVSSLGDLDGNGVPDLVIGAPGNSAGGRGRGSIWVVFLDCVSVPSRADVRLGSGLNPEDYRRTFNGPTIGNEWKLFVDAPDGASTWILGFARPIPGAVRPFGELLGAGRRSVLSRAVSERGRAVHRIPIPFDLSLLGERVTTQALVLDRGLRLLNAIDAELGCF